MNIENSINFHIAEAERIATQAENTSRGAVSQGRLIAQATAHAMQALDMAQNRQAYERAVAIVELAEAVKAEDGEPTITDATLEAFIALTRKEFELAPAQWAPFFTDAEQVVEVARTPCARRNHPSFSSRCLSLRVGFVLASFELFASHQEEQV